MYVQVVLAALLAGSKIATARVVFSGSQAGDLLPSEGWSGPNWRWGSYPHRLGHECEPFPDEPAEQQGDFPHGFIGEHRKGAQGNWPHGYIGPHIGHHRRPMCSGGGHRGHPRPHPTSGQPHPSVSPSSTTTPPTPSQTESPPSNSPTPQPGPTSTPPSHGGNSYQDQVIKFHNIHRANHSAPPVTWSEDLAQIAHVIAKSCVFAHNLSPGGGGYGQNIEAGTPPAQIGQIISGAFYNGEEPLYANFYGLAQPPMSNFENWGHFTQLVWKATSEVGCATQHCPDGVGEAGSNVQPFFTVCNYKSPGNVEGEYAKNVGRPLGHPTVNG